MSATPDRILILAICAEPDTYDDAAARADANTGSSAAHPGFQSSCRLLCGLGHGPKQRAFEVCGGAAPGGVRLYRRVDPTPYRLARRTDDTGAEILRATRHADVLHPADGTKLALFTSEFLLALVEREHPEMTLDRMLQRCGAAARTLGSSDVRE